MERKARRIGLSMKLNILLVACLLMIASGLVAITYSVYCRKVDSIYYAQIERALKDVLSNHLPPDYTSNLRMMTDTDEFREVHARAVAANDEQIIKDWMIRQPSTNMIKGYIDPDPSNATQEERELYSLYGDYVTINDWGLTDSEDIFGFDFYIQYVVDGVTYNLADQDMSLMDIGTPEEPIEAFAQYTDDDRVPLTIYHFGDDWLWTACEPILEEWDGDGAVAQLCVDVNMNDVIENRRWFLVNSAVFIVALTLAVMAGTLLLTRRMATKPLKQLAKGAAGFDMGDEGYSKDDVIQLPIRSNDEIGDLYHEIQHMQTRIVANADSLKRAVAERERVNTELSMAAKIQSAALPTQFLASQNRPEFDLYASMEPAKEVGGDFYDCFMVDDDHLALVIADVSDKGVPAALFMMSTKIIIKYRARMGGTPGEILTSANVQLSRNNPTRMFVTVWLGILELSTGRLSCTNAGHEYPFIRHPGGPFERLDDPHGIIMGVMKKATYQAYDIALEPGSKVFVYTDGLPEASNAKEEQFGMDRIAEALNADPEGAPRALLDNVQRAVDGFVDGAKQFDDLTMLCLEYRGPGREE